MESRWGTSNDGPPTHDPDGTRMSRLRLTRLLVLPVVALGLVSHHLHPEGSTFDRFISLVGLVLLIAAMGGRIWASAYVAGRKDRVLVTEGPYSVVRHPLYMFSFLGFIGVGLAFESLTLAALFGLIFLVGHWPAVVAEERRLVALFGDEYTAYRQEVPRFIPGFRSPRGGATLTLDMGRFRGMLRDCLAIPLVFVVVDLIEWTKLAGFLPILVEMP